MYLPKPPKDSKLYAYDVNSLYPSVMKDSDMPIGNPTFFKGDIRLIDPKAFGFFYCNITAPNNLNEPIIQTHVKTIDGKIVYKVKGLSHNIELTMNDFEHLLYKDTFIKKAQTK
jgi:hypothetical protein